MLLALFLSMSLWPGDHHPSLRAWRDAQPSERQVIASAGATVRARWLALCADPQLQGADRETALDLYAELGNATHVRWVLELDASTPSAQARTALQRIGQRDERALESVLQVAVQNSELRSLACVRAMELLALPGTQLGSGSQAKLETLLQLPDSALESSVVLLAGKWGADFAVPRLVELLGCSREGLRRDAHWALKQITGLALQPRYADWTQWLEREKRWWAERSEGAFAALQSGSELIEQRGLREIGERFWRKAELRVELERYLEAASGSNRQLALSILARHAPDSRKEIPAAARPRTLKPKPLP